MASTAVQLAEENTAPPAEQESGIRVLLADQQAIFRAGLRKIFALEDDIRVVGQAETLAQTIGAVSKFAADVLIFESALAQEPADVVADFLRKNPACRVVVVTERPEQELTLECFRRGAHSVVSREVEPEQLIDCIRAVAENHPWLDPQAVSWVLDAYRTQGVRPSAHKAKVQLTPKESIIVACVTQGMKNKEIAHRVGTTEQVVKNYLRKVYDKLGVADRLELALYCLHNRMFEGTPIPEAPTNGRAKDAPAAAAAAAGAGTSNIS